MPPVLRFYGATHIASLFLRFGRKASVLLWEIMLYAKVNRAFGANVSIKWGQTREVLEKGAKFLLEVVMNVKTLV